jgi:hypothetical protein
MASSVARELFAVFLANASTLRGGYNVCEKLF